MPEKRSPETLFDDHPGRSPRPRAIRDCVTRTNALATSGSPMISISIENLTKKFGSNVALDGLTFRIEPGELFFLLGPSGCGKTTLLRNIAGFYVPDGGRILFNDDDVTTLPPHKRNTGMMFQSYALWPHMTV
ncbi:MAG: ABC transporter ATP-binding protein, partial [Chthoniobacterales bacterium]